MDSLAKNKQFYNQHWGQTKVSDPQKWAHWSIIKYLKGKTLELGPGTRPKIKVKGGYFIDISQVAVDKLNSMGAVAQVHPLSEKLPFKNNFFQNVCAFEILEHLPNDQAVLKEINRILAKDGLLLVSFPINQKFWNSYDKEVGHIRRYDPAKLSPLFKKAGFKIESYALLNVPWPGKISGLVLAFFLRYFSTIFTALQTQYEAKRASPLKERINLASWKDFKQAEAENFSTILLIVRKV